MLPSPSVNRSNLLSADPLNNKHTSLPRTFYRTTLPINVRRYFFAFTGFFFFEIVVYICCVSNETISPPSVFERLDPPVTIRKQDRIAKACKKKAEKKKTNEKTSIEITDCSLASKKRCRKNGGYLCGYNASG